MKITLAHGSGGKLMNDLIQNVFARHFANATLDKMEDAAILELGGQSIAFTTDSFVVTPLFFPGGDIGRVSVCGTVNDLLMRGAIPKYLSAGFILEEGLDTDLLKKAVLSMRQAADEAGVTIVTGDTKVIEGKGGLYINTAGIGIVRPGIDISAHNAAPGDAVIISGTLGSHHACILSSRMNIKNSIKSDCAPLNEMVVNLLNSGLDLHAMRDITRGGLASVLNEIASSSRVGIELFRNIAFAEPQVRGFCDIMGLDPLYMGNEGKLALILPFDQADKALDILHASKYGQAAQLIGRVFEAETPEVVQSTRAGVTRTIRSLLGEGLPRIC